MTTPPISARPEPPIAAPARVWPIVLVLWLVMFMAACQFLIVAPVLPRIGAALHVRDGIRVGRVGLVVNVEELLAALLAP